MNTISDTISIKSVGKEADVSRKTFYRNFSSRDDVLNSYIDAILHSYVESIVKQGEYSFIQLLDIIFSFCEKNKEILFLLRDNGLLYLLLINLNSLLPAEHKKIARYSAESQDSFHNQLLSEYIIFFNIGGIWNIITKWVEGNMHDSVNDIKKLMMDYLSDMKDIDLRDI